MRILFVGGSFDNNGGRPSSVVAKMLSELERAEPKASIEAVNGGHYDFLPGLLDKTPDYDIVFWFANVPNDFEKVRNVKEVAPKVMLVTSKRNDGGKYQFNELVQRALGSKSNLLFEFSKDPDTKVFHIRVIDPLGCVWFDGEDIGKAVRAAMDRLTYLKGITRQSTVSSNVDKGLVLSWYFDSFKMDEKKSDIHIEIPDQTQFVGLVREYAVKLQEAMPDIKVERFLGNASLKLPPQIGRCGKGMPSFKQDGMIFVSRRNVPKQFIELSDFVPVYMENGQLYYCGDSKPSVDTPVQIRLYDALPEIRYMVHTHSYIKFAPFTGYAIPCGAVEEVCAVLGVVDKHFKSRTLDRYAINMKGHGSIIMASTVEGLQGYTFTKRPFPENMC